MHGYRPVASRVAARRIRWGVLCLPLAGLVYLQSLVVAGGWIPPSEDVRGYAEQITSARFQSGLMGPASAHRSALLPER